MNQFVEEIKPMPADVFARKALDAVDEAVIVIPVSNNLFWWFDCLFPEWNLRSLTQQVAAFFSKDSRLNKITYLQEHFFILNIMQFKTGPFEIPITVQLSFDYILGTAPR